jgi:hypothetical protein
MLQPKLLKVEALDNYKLLANFNKMANELMNI